MYYIISFKARFIYIIIYFETLAVFTNVIIGIYNLNIKTTIINSFSNHAIYLKLHYPKTWLV